MLSFGASKLVGCQYLMIDIFLMCEVCDFTASSAHQMVTLYLPGPPEKISTVREEVRQY